LIRLAAGLLRPTNGALAVLGFDTRNDPQQIQDRIGYMPQRFGLYEDLSVQENLDLYADLHGVTAEQRAQRYPELLNMTALLRFTDRLAGQLSGGMNQKAWPWPAAGACQRNWLLLDEPTVGVDPLSRSELWTSSGSWCMTRAHRVDEAPRISTKRKCASGIDAHRGFIQ